MTQISKKAYKGLPVGIKVRKPHYYYQDFLEVFNDNAEKYIELREFEGLDYSFNRSQVTFDEKVLWNGYTSPNMIKLLAPSGETYLTSVRKLVYGVNGSPTIVDNVASGFSSSNYVTIDTPKFSEADTWEIFTKLIIGSDVASEQYIYQFSKTSADSGRFGVALINVSGVIGLNLSFTGSAWASDSDFTSVVNNNYTLEANTTYYAKFSFDGNCYRIEMSKNNIDWDIAVERYTTTKVYSELTYTRLGSYNGKSVYFRGSIDLNESYIKLDDKIVWGKDAINVVDGVGCLDNITDVAEERTLTAFVKDDEILLSESGDDKVGYTWANKVTIPQHEVIPIYKKKFSETNTNYKYTYQDENILVSLNPSGELVLSEPVVFNFIPPTSFFDYDVRFTAKVTPVDASKQRVICYVPFTGNWFGTNSGKLCLYNKLTADAALTANTTYWVRMAETYSVSTGQYIHRIAYIVDNGYTRKTLPDESEWVVKTISDATPWFGSESTISNFGNTASASWYGTMDLTNIWVDYGNTTDIGDGGRLYQTKWEMLEKV